MTNYIMSGEVLTLAAPYTVTSGQGALVGKIFGVATGNVTSGANGEFRTKGVFTLTKLAASVFTQGAAVYWDDSQRKCTAVDSGNSYLIGRAISAPAANATTVDVWLNGGAIS